MSTTKKMIRCAIYTRKSHEEGLDQEFNSLDAQRQAGEAYIASQRQEGWQCIRKRYDDGGFSGGNLERPALAELLDDIRARQVDCVVVYKVDRLSRSLLDFAKLIGLFDECSVSFVSVTQQFNTTTPMGRLTLNILLSFAQFEREIIGERIRDKKLATAQQGKYIGGQPILGLDIVDRKYVVNEVEASEVRRIFALFEKLRTCRKVADTLNAEGIRTKSYVTKTGVTRGNREWNFRKVYSLLTQRMYIGQIVHKGKFYPAEHPAIVPTEQFERVAAILRANMPAGAEHKTKRFFLLRGMLQCGECGSLIQPTWAKKASREIHYYACRKKIVTGYTNCRLPCLPAGQIETAIIDQLRALLRHPEVVARTYRQVRQMGGRAPDPATVTRLEDLRQRQDQIHKSIRAVLSASHGDECFLTAELKRLNNELKALEQSIRQTEGQLAGSEPVELNQMTAALKAVEPVWDVLFPEEQRRIIQLLVESITVSQSGIDMRFRNNGIEQIVKELQPIEERMHA